MVGALPFRVDLDARAANHAETAETRLVERDELLRLLRIWEASSRVGDIATASIPRCDDDSAPRSRSIVGSKNPIVLPVQSSPWL